MEKANVPNRVTPGQKELIVAFMETHPTLVAVKGGKLTIPQGEASLLWRQLTDLLNGSGENVTKNAEKWRKTWRCMKRDVKEKTARIQKQQKQGTGPVVDERFTPLQERLSTLLSKIEEGLEDEDPSGSETDASKSGNAEDLIIDSEADGSKDEKPVETTMKNWVVNDNILDNLVIKQEVNEVENGNDAHKEKLYPIHEQNGTSPPTAKKPRRLSPAETSISNTSATTVQADTKSTEKLCARHASYSTLAHNQAATASALSRLADVAERRLAIEERKAAAMEKFVELFFKPPTSM